jgi:hypothetical protein
LAAPASEKKTKKERMIGSGLLSTVIWAILDTVAILGQSLAFGWIITTMIWYPINLISLPCEMCESDLPMLTVVAASLMYPLVRILYTKKKD